MAHDSGKTRSAPAGKAFETAKPSVTSAASEASSLSPSALGQYALIALGVWFLVRRGA